MPITLPTELWIRTLSFIADDFNDRPKLWVSGRAVCTAFKEAIETIFREKHLPKTFIAYSLGWILHLCSWLIQADRRFPTGTHYLDNDSDDGNDESGPNKIVLCPEFEFSHLSADKTTAFFIDEHVHPKFKPLVTRILRSCIDPPIRFEKPSHTVQVRRELNDTPIPGLSIDYDTMTLSCDWRGLYSAFFAEEHLVHKIRERDMETFDARRTALINNVRGGQMDIVAAMQEMVTRYGGATDEARKQARRVRIRRQYEQLGYSGWNPEEDDKAEENRINRAVKERIFFASAQTFSDEEDGDDKEAEDEDGEWEDEEGEEDGENEGNQEGLGNEEGAG